MSEPGSLNSSRPQSSRPGSSGVSPDGGSREHPAVSVVRLAVTAGGAVALGFAGLVPPLWCLGALVAIAVPTHAGKLIDLMRGK